MDMPEIYYTSSDPVFGKMTMKQFIETEVNERGNYPMADVQNWMRKYGLSRNDLSIWVSPKKWVANRYNLLADERDEAENIPESEMEVNEIKGSEGFIIPESDDGDEGYLFVFKRNVNPMVRESQGQGEKITKVIEDAKKKPYSGTEKRDEIRAGLTALASDTDRSAITELRSFRPLGMMSEFGAAMGAEPRKGVKIDTPFGPYVFDEKRVPSNERVERWYAQHKEAEGIRTLAAEYAFGLGVRPNTVTGNFRVVERGRRFKEQGLLSLEEEHIMDALEKYWQDHPDLDRQKGYGIWGYNLDIMVPEGPRKNMTEQKGSLIDALLKSEPGKYIIIHYSDIPKDAERIIHLPTDNLSQPTNLTGSVLERKGDLIVVAIYADNIITAHIFLQKGSQLIQIRPIPRKTTPIKGGEAITIYYTNWVERIKREAPEYLPEWEKVPKQPWEMTRGEAIAEASRPLGSMGISWGELRTALSSGRKYAESMHKDMVKLAIVEKKHVPAEVLNEYQDLITKKKEPWEMTYREFADFFEGVAGKFVFAEQVGKPLGIQSQNGEPYRMIKDKRIGYSGMLERDRWRLAIVDKALSEGKHVPSDVIAELSESLKVEKEKLGGAGQPTKETWEMTRAEFSKQEWFQRTYGGMTGANLEAAFSLHRVAIQNALESDKPVPPEVLKEYQGLKKKEVPVIHTYYFRNRPPDIGTQPKGAFTKEAWLPMRKTPKGNMAFGWAKYERELTPDEIKNYELFVDEIVMPKLVAELVKFTYDEGIFEGFNVLKSKTGWSEYGLAFRDWLKANNEWKPDRGEEAEFLRHLARFTGKTPPEPKLEDQEKAKLFLSALSRFTLNELIQQEATVRRWSIKFPQMEKELEDEYKMYLELRRAEKATAEEARKEKASKPQSDQAKELYKQMRKTNSVRELDDWRNKVLFEAHLPNVEEDILLRDLAAKWRTYLETRGVPALEALDKLPIEYTNEDYYFSTEVWIHPTTTIFDDQPLKGRLRQALNGGELFEVAIEGREGTQRTQIDRIYVTKVIEKDRIKPEQAIKIAADSIAELRSVDVFRVLNQYKESSFEIGEYIKKNRPDLIAAVEKVFTQWGQKELKKPDDLFEDLLKKDRIRSVILYGTTKWQYRDARNIFTMAPDKEAAIERAAEAIKDQPKKDKFAEIQDQMQKDKDKIAGEHLREVAGTMTSKEFTDEALKLNIYREKYEKNPKLLNDYTKSMIQKWKELVEKHGETGKLPDKVIEDYINLFGEPALFSVFRGIKAKGIEGWRLPPAQIESAESLYKRYTSGYSAVSLLGIVRQESKDLAHSIGFELKLNTATYIPAVLLPIAEKFKIFAQRDFDIEHEKHEKKRLKEQAEKDIERQQGGQAFWDEVKNLKVMDFEVEHDINPDKPSRDYYHVYDRTFAIIENGKKIQISYVIYKGEEGKRALKATKEFYARIYGQYMGKPLSEWVTYDQLISGNRYEDYQAQKAKARFTFIPEAPQAALPAEQQYVPHVGDMVRVIKIWGDLTAEDVLEVAEVNELLDAWLIKRISPREIVKYGGTRATNLILVKRAEKVAIQQSPGVQAMFNAYISSTLLTTGALASPKFLSDERMAQDIEKNIQVSKDEARALVPQFRAIAEKMINKEEIESIKETFGIDVEQEAHNLGIDLADYAIIKAGNKVVLQHKTSVQRQYEIKQPAGFVKKRVEETQGKLQEAQRRKDMPVPPAAKPVQSIQEIKQQVLDSIQAASTIEELQPVMKGIGFLPLPEPDKRQVIDAYQNKYSLLMSERPFGVPVKGEEKVRAIGAPTPQQLFEAEQRRKAVESRKISAPPTLTSGAITARRLEMFEPGAMEKAKAGIDARKRIEQLGLPYDVHPYVRKLAAGTQDVMKFGTKRGKESVEDLVLTRYVRYCPPGTIIDNKNVPKVPERWWVYPPKLRACMGEIEKKLAEAGAGMMVKEGQLTPSMRSYIRGAEAVLDVIHYYRDNRPPTRGILYRARDGTFFVEAGGQVYASMGWEDVSQARMTSACRATA